MYGTVHSRMPQPSTIRPALVRIIQRLAAAGGDVITVHAGVSALRTAHALAFAEDAAAAGARGLLLAPQSYQPLTDDDVAGLYTDVTAAAAEHLGLAAPGCLPRPLLRLGPADRAEVADVVDRVLDGEPTTRP